MFLHKIQFIKKDLKNQMNSRFLKSKHYNRKLNINFQQRYIKEIVACRNNLTGQKYIAVKHRRWDSLQFISYLDSAFSIIYYYYYYFIFFGGSGGVRHSQDSKNWQISFMDQIVNINKPLNFLKLPSCWLPHAYTYTSQRRSYSIWCLLRKLLFVFNSRADYHIGNNGRHQWNSYSAERMVPWQQPTQLLLRLCISLYLYTYIHLSYIQLSYNFQYI